MDSLIFRTGFAEWDNFSVPEPDTTKPVKAKILRDTIWYPEKRFDTIPVPVEMTDGKIVNMLAIYQHGRNIAGKDAPRFVGYLNTNKRKLTAAQKPKKVRWDKMKSSK